MCSTDLQVQLCRSVIERQLSILSDVEEHVRSEIVRESTGSAMYSVKASATLDDESDESMNSIETPSVCI